MEIHHIEQDYRRKEKARIDRLRRVSRAERANKVREIKDSQKDKEESKNKRQEVVADVVIQQTDKGSSCGTTIELTEKASRIADRYEVQKHMEGQHIGSIDRLRSSLNEVVDEKEAIKKVQQTAKMKQAMRAYGKNGKNTQTSKDEER